MRRVVMGVVMAALTTAIPAMAGADTPQLSASRDGERATLVVRAGELTVTEILRPTGLDLTLAHQGDEVRFAGDLDGRVTIERGGRRVSVEMRSATMADQSSMQSLLSNSSALAAFDSLTRSSWAESVPAAQIFVSTRELLRIMQGEIDVVSAMARRQTSTTATMMFARQRLSPSQCWDTYTRDVTKFTYELQSCISQVEGNWWNPLHLAWCSYEYNLKSSLAAVWLLDCYGVPL